MPNSGIVLPIVPLVRLNCLTAHSCGLAVGLMLETLNGYRVMLKIMVALKRTVPAYSPVHVSAVVNATQDKKNIVTCQNSSLGGGGGENVKSIIVCILR